MRLAVALLLSLTLPAAALAQADPHAAHSAHAAHGATKPAIKPKTRVPATDIAPSYVQLATNVEVIPNIEDAVKNKSAVATHEGVFGPLLFAEETRAFFIELQPGMFLAEHPHDIGSIIYTVRGKWVLASEGKRQVMQAGTLFRFGDNMPTGWEAPFNEPALLLVVKPKGENKDYDVFNRGIKAMRAATDKDRRNGAAFYYSELKPDDPAIAFARSVNPNFDAVLKIKP
ncbi:MAG: cupin domain-containing protein [Phenylobacterium sp.]|uniref:cupin domain-containing protein n=1 Tax=Phenylobacterium sp. TaxID=1871053 RepID=UPI001A5CF815|nr:cupin domain-containing protein [Phenylobacterium sp.]MBL8556559.1 cupin domain-containing protein [Phenylobacterium sp.]